MTFVVVENCIKCKHTDCVEVCPVDCFYEGPNFLVIHPDECIDCALCEPECPVDAIFSEDELPDDQQQFIELNAELAEIWPNITEKKDAPADAEEWDGVDGKPSTSSAEHSALRQQSARINRLALAPDLEVQDARRVAGQPCHLIARDQVLSLFDEDLVVVGVGREPGFVMLHDDNPTVSAQARPRINHFALGSRANHRARRSANI